MSERTAYRPMIEEDKPMRLWLWLKGPKRLWRRRCNGECGSADFHTHDLTRLSSWALRSR